MIIRSKKIRLKILSKRRGRERRDLSSFVMSIVIFFELTYSSIWLIKFKRLRVHIS